ncbi:MAG: transposase [Prosthecobacter sp.]
MLATSFDSRASAKSPASLWSRSEAATRAEVSKTGGEGEGVTRGDPRPGWRQALILTHMRSRGTIDELIHEGDRVVYADSAYSGAPIEAALAAKCVEPRINVKGTRRHPLNVEQKASKREKSRTRSRVEHVFAQMSGSMKAHHQRCIGLKRNEACLTFTNLVCNMLRFEQIKRLKLNAAA